MLQLGDEIKLKMVRNLDHGRTYGYLVPSYTQLRISQEGIGGMEVLLIDDTSTTSFVGYHSIVSRGASRWCTTSTLEGYDLK